MEKRANNVLLFGDAGTGKSSSVKAVLNEYYSRGLRMIEVYKHQFKALFRCAGADQGSELQVHYLYG